MTRREAHFDPANRVNSAITAGVVAATRSRIMTASRAAPIRFDHTLHEPFHAHGKETRPPDSITVAHHGRPPSKEGYSCRGQSQGLPWACRHRVGDDATGRDCAELARSSRVLAAQGAGAHLGRS